MEGKDKIPQGRAEGDPVRYRIIPRDIGRPNFEFIDAKGKIVSQHYIRPLHEDMHRLEAEVSRKFIEEETRSLEYYNILLSQFIRRQMLYLAWYPEEAEIRIWRTFAATESSCGKEVFGQICQIDGSQTSHKRVHPSSCSSLASRGRSNRPTGSASPGQQREGGRARRPITMKQSTQSSASTKISRQGHFEVIAVSRDL